MSRILFTGGGGSGPRGCLLLGGDLVPGVPGPGGCLLRGGGVPAWWRPAGRLLLRVVRILLECILVVNAAVKLFNFMQFLGKFDKIVY